VKRDWRGPIIALFLLLCAVNNALLPVFEAPDEIAHYQFAAYLMRERRLPDLNGALPSHEAAQPPLYYAFVALVISPFDHTNLETIRLLEPAWFDRVLNPDLITVANQHQHTSSDEIWPWRGAVWGVRAARMLSSVLGTLTVLGVFAIAQAATRGDQTAAALAAALTAFNPKFIHVASIVNNDIAVTCAATLAMAMLCRLLDRSSTARARGWVALGALIGVATLCKLGGLGLFAPAGLALLARGRATFVRDGAALALGVALIAGPWLIHNTVANGNPLAFAQVRAANAALLRTTPLGIVDMLATAPDLLASYYGRIGIGFDLPGVARLALAAGLLLAVLGCVIRVSHWLTSRPKLRGMAATPLGALLIWQLALIALFVPWLRSYAATENSRLLLPGVAAVSTWVALGWLALSSAQRGRAIAATGAAALFAIAASTPWTTIQPAFALPEMRAAPDATTPLATFDGRIRLLSARLDATRLTAGTPARVSLTWGALQPLGDSYRVLIEAIDVDGQVVGRRMFIPFNGRYDTRRWQPGGVFDDVYELPIQASPAPMVARVELSIFKQYPEPGLLPIDSRVDRTVSVGRVKLGPRATNPDAGANAVATFGDAIRLTHWQFDAGQTVFVWDVTQTPAADYTLFVKAFDAAGNQVLAEDAQPFNAQYPTGLWERGERVRDIRAFAIPERARRVQIGWYDASGARLIAVDADGQRWRDDIVELTSHR
jgi:hypothetical protein